MKIIILSCFLLLVNLSLTQVVTPSCSSDSSCNTLRLFNSKRCSSSSCVTYGEAAYKSTPSSTEFCKNSLRINFRCSSYAALDCSIPTGDILHRVCLQGSLQNGKCTDSSTPNTDVFSSKNARCDLTANPREICPSGQSCVNKVCREQLKIGDFCSGNDAGCRIGSGCDMGTCTLLYSKRDGEKSSNSVYCTSQSLSNGICIPNSVTPCFTNSDCPSGGVCRKPAADSTTDVRGSCFNPSLNARFEYNKCQYDTCYNSVSSKDLTSTCIESCTAQYVKLQCSLQCINRVDQRISNVPYIFDCAAFTKRNITTGTDCEITEQYTNCDAIINYNSSNNSKGLSTLIKAQIAFAITFVLYFIY